MSSALKLKLQIENNGGGWTTIKAWSAREDTSAAIRDATNLQALRYCVRVLDGRKRIYGGCYGE